MWEFKSAEQSSPLSVAHHRSPSKGASHYGGSRQIISCLAGRATRRARVTCFLALMPPSLDRSAFAADWSCDVSFLILLQEHDRLPALSPRDRCHKPRTGGMNFLEYTNWTSSVTGSWLFEELARPPGRMNIKSDKSQTRGGSDKRKVALTSAARKATSHTNFPLAF